MSSRVEVGYFQRSWPVYSILGAFFLITLPLCALGAGDRQFLNRWSIGLVYLCCLGMTHFVLTFTVYFQSENLRYYRSTWSNRVIYFAIPVLIFLFFDLYRALRIAAALPILDIALRWCIRLADFQHFGRQNYGVLQLLKARSGAVFPAWMKQAENVYFSGMTLLLFLVYVGGGEFRLGRPTSLILLGVVLVLLIRVLVAFVLARPGMGRRTALLPPLAYFLLQSASAGLAVYSTALYAFALAMHYVEYHVLMIPRCFHAPLDERTPTDRLFGRLRRHKVLFYGVLILAAAVVTHYTWLGMMPLLKARDGSKPTFYLALISLFDGLFVVHYFLESLIWRFSDPYYRKTLGPLYFGRARPSETRPDAPAPPPRQPVSLGDPEPASVR